MLNNSIPALGRTPDTSEVLRDSGVGTAEVAEQTGELNFVDAMAAQANLEATQPQEQPAAEQLEHQVPADLSDAIFRPLFHQGSERELAEIRSILQEIDMLKSGVRVEAETLEEESPALARDIEASLLHDQEAAGSGVQRRAYYEAKLKFAKYMNALAQSWNTFMHAAKKSRTWNQVSQEVNKTRKNFNTAVGTAGA